MIHFAGGGGRVMVRSKKFSRYQDRRFGLGSTASKQVNAIHSALGTRRQPEYSAIVPIASPPTVLTRTLPRCQTRMWYSFRFGQNSSRTASPLKPASAPAVAPINMGFRIDPRRSNSQKSTVAETAHSSPILTQTRPVETNVDSSWGSNNVMQMAAINPNTANTYKYGDRVSLVPGTISQAVAQANTPAPAARAVKTVVFCSRLSAVHPAIPSAALPTAAMTTRMNIRARTSTPAGGSSFAGFKSESSVALIR